MFSIQQLKGVCSGLGKVDCSPEAIPSFQAKNKGRDICRVATTALIGAVAMAAIICGIVAAAIGGPLGVLTGIGCLVLGLLSLAWVVIVALRLLGVGGKAKPKDNEDQELIVKKGRDSDSLQLSDSEDVGINNRSSSPVNTTSEFDS
ncbi:hypothetical protein [Chlamydia sp. 17-3921]|uniref:hypothetical protein n=1 Tax=Chlamydia sp. 17-3921 TaxID=2675798 RepID=UPI00191B646D|nr:hypothetical protein [Chlamydia sp. 17-3921]